MHRMHIIAHVDVNNVTLNQEKLVGEAVAVRSHRKQTNGNPYTNLVMIQ